MAGGERGGEEIYESRETPNIKDVKKMSKNLNVVP